MKDVAELAHAMAVAIMRERVARSSSVVGKDGRQRVTFQMMQACKQLDDAFDAFCTATATSIERPEQYSDAEALLHWTGIVMPTSEEAETAPAEDLDLVDIMRSKTVEKAVAV